MATVKFYCNNPKAGGMLKATEVSINMRFTVDRNFRFLLATGERIVPKFWDSKKQEVKSNYRHHVEVNMSLQKIKRDILQLWRENKDADLATLRTLARPIVTGRGVQEQKKTVVEIVQQFIAQYAKEKASSSTKRYKVLLNRLIEYDQFQRQLMEVSKDKQKIYEHADELDFNFYDEFKNWLYDRPNPLYTGYSLYYDSDLEIYALQKDDQGLPVGLFDEVVYKYFINLKTVMAWAEQRGNEVHPAYKKWPIIRREYDVISLSFDELKRLEQSTMPSKRLEIARDYLALECRTGQRISDLKRFNIADVKDNKWTFVQKKGNRLINKTVTVPFIGYCQPAYWILQKYGFRMPAVSEQNLNYAIKEACKEAGIDQDIYIDRWAGNKRIRIPGKKYEFISTHNGRKSFITIALQHMLPKLVMDLTGIRSFKTLKHYEGESDVQEIEKQLISIEDNSAIMRKAQ